MLVGTGTDGNLDIVACGPQAVAFFAEAGTTYYILAIDDQQNGDGLNGGTLNLSMYEIVSPTIDTFTVNRYGTVNTRTGVATISGTYSCSNADFMDVFVDARQPVGRFMILGTGEFFDFNTCDGTTHTWSAQVFPENGKFAGGNRDYGLGDLFRRAVTLSPFAALELFCIVGCGCRADGHRVRVDLVLHLLRELFLHRAPLSLDGKRLGDVFPVRDAVFCHGFTL